MTGRAGGLLFVAPFLFFYVTILVLPLLRGLWLSFTSADPFGGATFVGLQNYARLLVDPEFRSSLLHTLELTLLIVPALTATTLALALALNRPGRTAAVLRAVFFSSSVLSVTIVTLIWRFVLTPDAGLLAEIAQALGRTPTPWLSDPDLALPALALTTIWWSIGAPMLLFLAGLQQIPHELYEAAALDRATPWRTFRHVTLPSLRRTVVLVVLLQTAAQLQLFGQAQLLTGGGPGGASRTLVLYVFEAAFGRWELGYALAASQVLFALVLVVTLVQYRVAAAERG